MGNIEWVQKKRNNEMKMTRLFLMAFICSVASSATLEAADDQVILNNGLLQVRADYRIGQGQLFAVHSDRRFSVASSLAVYGVTLRL